jgi:hypothetical protein
MPVDPPGPLTAGQFQDELHKLQATARSQHLGVYGNLDSPATTTAAGGKVAAIGTSPSTAAKPAPQGGYVPVTYLLPPGQHPPDVVENPIDDALADFSIDAAAAPLAVQVGIPEDDYSEIPGWKPKSTPKPKKKADAAPDEAPDEVPD